MTAGFEMLTEAQLRARGTAKWVRYGEDVLPMWIAEMDYNCAPPVQAAIEDVARRQVYGYPGRSGPLIEAFTQYATRWGSTIDPGKVTVLPDVLRGVEIGIEVFSPAGSPVVLPSPAYMPFWEIPGLVGREIISVPMGTDAQGRRCLDLDAIDAAFAAGARSIILCQPYNPLGRVFTVDELRALTAVVDAHGAWVISDEIHAPLVFDGVTVPYASTSDAAAAHTITVTSGSKAWNLPGLRCGLAFTHTAEAHRRFVANAPAAKIPGHSTFGMAAQAAAFTDGQPWLDAALAQLSANIDYLAGYVAEHWPGVKFTPMQGTYLAWLDFTAMELPEDPGAWLLSNAKVALNAGPTFGPGGEGHARMNLATSPQILSEACERITAALARR